MAASLIRTLRNALALAAAITPLAYALPAHAEWPDRNITMIVPFPPGGNTDVLGRIVAAKLTTALHTHVIVENRPGAGSMLGTQFVARSKPDGYTILMGSISNVLNDFFYKKPLYDIRKDLIPVSQVVNVPNYFAVSPATKIDSLAQLISYAKQNPGKASCATSGVGTSPFLSCELFKRMAGVQMTTVPYQAYVRSQSPHPVSSCETLFGIREFKPFLDANAVDVGIVDTIWNGVWQSMKIAAFCDAHDVNVAPHNFYGHLCTMINASFAAAVPNLRIMETDIDRLAWDDELFTHAPEYRDGELIIADRPGWGTDPVEEAILAHPPKVTGGLLQYKRS